MPLSFFDRQYMQRFGQVPPGVDPVEAQMEMGQGGQAAPQNPPLAPLTPEDESSLLATLGQKALGGLGYVGGALGKLGRAARGIIGGVPREALNVIPFSDALGLTDPKQQVTGASLIGADPNAGFFDPGNLAGIGVDIATDPLTYLTFGGAAVNKLGQAASKLGTLPATGLGRLAGFAAGTPELEGLAQAIGRPAAELAGQALGSSVGARIPFGPATAFTGPIAQRLTGGMDVAGKWLGATAPVRYARSLFDNRVGGAISAPGQEAALAANQAFQNVGAPAARGQGLEALNALSTGGVLDQRSLIRQIAEQPTQLGQLTAGMAPDQIDALAQTTQRMRGALETSWQQEHDLGLPTPHIEDYFPAYKAPLDRETAGYTTGGRSALPTTHAGMTAREEILNNFVEGRSGVERLVQDQGIRDMIGANPQNPLAPAAAIRDKYLGSQAGADALRLSLGDKLATQGLTAAEEATLNDLNATYNQSQRLVDWVKNQDPRYAAEQLPFWQHPVTDFAARQLASQRVQAGAEAAHTMLAQTARGAAQAAPGDVPLLDAMIGAGFQAKGEAGITGPASEQMMSRLTQTMGITSPDEMRNLFVPAQVAADAARYTRAVSAPQGLQPFLKVFDSLTNLTKAGQTAIWPAFHARNWVTGLWQNWVTGKADPRYSPLNPMAYIAPYQDAWALRAGNAIGDTQAIKGLENLSPEAASQQISTWGHQYGLIGQKGQMGEVLGAPSMVGNELRLPGEAQPSLLETLKGAVDPAAWAEVRKNPANLLGVAGVEIPGMGRFGADVNPLVKVGRQVGEITDESNRMSSFVADLRNGYTPEMAAQRAQLAHYDYCVDESTEALSRRGWLRWDELHVGDEVLTINPKTRQIAWEPVKSVNVFDHCGPMTYWKTVRFDALTTGAHRWLAEGVGHRGGHWTTRLEKGKTHFVTTSQVVNGLTQKLIVGGGKPVADARHPIYSDDFVKLIGWFVTEGWVHPQTRFGAYVSQSPSHNPIHVNEIKQLASNFRDTGVTVSEYPPNKGGTVTWYFGRGIGELLRKVAPNKELTVVFLCSLTSEQLQLLYRTLMAGDGHVKQDGASIFGQKDKGRLDSFQMLCAMLGKRTHSRVYNPTGCSQVTIYRSGTLYTENLTHREIFYRGKVWCPTTPSGTWMARRNGKTYWTGNSNLTPFERGTMRRLVPFYSWLKGNIPFTIQQLAQEPGGRLATAFKVAAQARGQSDVLPDYLADTLGMKVGPEQDGTQRFFTHTGLPFEDALSMIRQGPGNLPTPSGLDILGNLNPLIKAPLESMTGKQFYSGRDMADLYSQTGSPLLDQIISNSPIGRAVSTARTLTDPRKDLLASATNLLTGAKYQDVDIEKARQTAARQIIDDMMRGNSNIGTYSDIYVRPGMAQNLTPEQVAIMRLNKTIEQQKRVGVRQAATAP